jgi:predicted dehydrogenase/nucleoside-diphosphate-sugar epimerase
MTLRVGFIGAGRMARHHLRALTKIGVPCDVVGVHDRASGSAEEFAALAGTRAYGSIATLLQDARPDIVHVCTSPGAHVEAAAAALESGAHVYVEKPFALTISDATRLLDMACARGLLVCAGHQLLHDRAFEALVARAPGLGTPVQIDSHFAFRPAGASAERRGARMLARQLVDVLPHPLYSLVAVLERFTAPGARIDVPWIHATPTELQAALRAGDVVGRLSVSLRARPVASFLTFTGTHGSVTCDFVRSVLVGAANPGTEPLEKVLNPVMEGAQLITRSALSVGRRVRSGGSYPGLVELIGAFYEAVAARGSSPIAPDHLLRVTRIFQQLVARIEAAADRAWRAEMPARPNQAPPLTVVTGARGFLGTEIARALSNVRGIGRDGWPDAPQVREWVVADLSAGLSPQALAGADVVVHAAAETSGGYEAHQRNTIDATGHLLRAMHAAGVRRLVLVSSLSVLRPPRLPWERQDERTPRPIDSRRFGAYTWGKCVQEELVEREASRLGIETRTVRPGALIDWDDPSLPGLMGRRLFGRWHLGLGRPQLPIAVCDVKRCAAAIAWCATHFEQAPRVAHVIDPTLTTRAAFLARLRSCGWNGRMLWVPISLLAFGVSTLRLLAALAHGRLPDRLAVWSILRPRRHDVSVSRELLEAARRAADLPAEAGSHVTPTPEWMQPLTAVASGFSRTVASGFSRKMKPPANADVVS